MGDGVGGVVEGTVRKVLESAGDGVSWTGIVRVLSNGSSARLGRKIAATAIIGAVTDSGVLTFANHTTTATGVVVIAGNHTKNAFETFVVATTDVGIGAVCTTAGL